VGPHAALTPRPFAVNHTVRPLTDDAFAATLRFKPHAISFHLAVPPDLIAEAHAAGILWIQQVMTAAQAEQALAAGADVLVAQGGEAGGNGGFVAAMVLVPQVVDLAGEVPVVAAGGLADGRGLAAALVLGAQGVSMGTRFLASDEMRIADAWKRRIVDADALDAVKVEHGERVMPPFSRPVPAVQPRVLRTDFSERLREHPEEFDPSEVGPRLVAALRAGEGHDELPFTGQSAALVRDVLPAAEIVRRVVAGAEAALRSASRAASA
jgi:enoyl-[acyl-carrier protein] reductase II